MSGSLPRGRLEEISIGDYVLSGGEIAAMVVCDACVRLLPGVMGKRKHQASRRVSKRGFSNIRILPGPRDWEGREIPKVLLSGDHAKIKAWREAEALKITRERRPDLLKRP